MLWVYDCMLVSMIQIENQENCKCVLLAFLLIAAFFLMFVVSCITAGIHTGNTLEICSCKGHIFIRKLAIQNE